MQLQNIESNEPLAVGVGAGTGALTRYVLTAGLLAVLPAAPHYAFLVTLGINVLGSYAMGYFRPGPLLGTGFLGGFTTFSALTVAAAQTTATTAFIYVLSSVVLCIAGWWAGDTMRDRKEAGDR